jgi:hypothetical protein
MEEHHILLQKMFYLRSIVSYRGIVDPSSMQTNLIYIRLIQEKVNFSSSESFNTDIRKRRKLVLVHT